PPVSSDNGRPADKSTPLEVPAYLSDSRESSWWPLIATMATALVLALGVLRTMGPFDGTHPLAGLLGGKQAVETTEEGGDSKTTTDEATAKTAASEAVATTAESDESTPTSNVPPAPAPPPATNVATADAQPAISPVPGGAIERAT